MGTKNTDDSGLRVESSLDHDLTNRPFLSQSQEVIKSPDPSIYMPNPVWFTSTTLHSKEPTTQVID